MLQSERYIQLKRLKQLIKREAKRCNNVQEFESAVLELLAIEYGEEQCPDWQPYTDPSTSADQKQHIYTNDYYETCPCNPKNGGSGNCNCILSNIIVTYQ